jgi:hypothetical protein
MTSYLDVFVIFGFDLMLVLPKDLIEFLRLIDMYPTQSLGIQWIEQNLMHIEKIVSVSSQ